MEKRENVDLHLGHLFGFEHVDVAADEIRETIALAFNKIGEEGPIPAQRQPAEQRAGV